MKGIRTILYCAALLCMTCCQNSSTDLASFLADDTMRLEINGERIFSYSPGTCQMAYNGKRCEFRAHSDTMLDYFVITLDTVPILAGNKVTATIAWSTPSGERKKENVTLNAIRIVGDVIWLRDESGRNAAVVRILE